VADQRTLKQIAPLQGLCVRQLETVYFQQESMLLKARALTDMESAQLSQGFDPEPGKSRRELTDARNRFFPGLGDGIKQQKIRQTRIDVHNRLFSHA